MPGESGPQEEAEEEEEGRGGNGTAFSASQDTSSPIIHMVNQTNAQEIIYYVLSEALGESPRGPKSPSGCIMEKLQGIAEEPEVQMVLRW